MVVIKMVWDKIQAKYDEIVKILEAKAAGAITASVQAGSATSEGLESKPRYSPPPYFESVEEEEEIVAKMEHW